MRLRGRAPTADANDASLRRGRGFRFLWTDLTPGRRGRLALVAVSSFLGGLVDAASLLVLARIAFALVNDNKPVNATCG